MSLSEPQIADAAEINNNIEGFTGDQPQMRAVCDGITAECLQRDLAYEEWVNCSYVVPHPDNRAGVGVDAMDVQELLADMVTDGFVWSGVGTPTV